MPLTLDYQTDGNAALQANAMVTANWNNAVYWLYQEDDFTPTARYQRGQLHYIVADQVGTITELLTEDGYIDYRQKLNLWGEAEIDGHRHYAANDSNPLSCNHRFVGQYYDEESGLHYNRFRYYSSETGQYLSHDPIGLLGGFNPYGYVGNPTGFVDPLGLQGCPPALAQKTEEQLALPAPKDSNPWMEGTPIESFPAPKGGIEVEMALAPGQTRPGGWATTDHIPDVNYVRNQLAVTPEFKPEVGNVQKFLIPEGVQVQSGTVGPQTYNGITYPGGGSQIQILNITDRGKLIPIGQSRVIK